jgi:hypothetical protein
MISDVFSIRAMSNIFKEAEVKLSYGAMQLYQNILQHHFSDKEEVVGNLNSFVMKFDDIPNYGKYRKELSELELAKLISFDNIDEIHFLDVWTKHIQLGRMKANNKMQLASAFKEEMQNSQQLLEAVAMKLRVKTDDVHKLLQLFFAEQDGIQKQYPNESECRKHFIYWSQHNANKIEKTTVRSTSKILGKPNAKEERR